MSEWHKVLFCTYNIRSYAQAFWFPQRVDRQTNQVYDKDEYDDYCKDDDNLDTQRCQFNKGMYIIYIYIYI